MRKQTDHIVPGQLALDLPPTKSVARADLVVGVANSLAIDLIDAWPDWPGNTVVVAGPVGSGKSHIAAVWAQNSGARVVEISQLALLADDRDNDRPLLLENAGKDVIDETALFHILNAKRSQNAGIIITSRFWPSDWGIELADLASRLRAAQLVELGEPDDDLLRGVLCKLFADHQLPIEANVVDFLVVRMERSLESANQIVANLDALGLAKKRKITRRLAGEVLERIEGGAVK